MSTEPTNDELAQGYAKQIEQAQQRREAKDLERLERHGQAAAQQSQAIEAEQKQGQQGQGFELDAGQKVELNEINGQQAKTLAKELNRDNENGDQVKLRFTTADDLQRGDLPEFLAEHLAAVDPSSVAAS